jgi:hypothetical protein
MVHYYSHMGHISGSHDEMWTILCHFYDESSDIVYLDSAARNRGSAGRIDADG